MQPAQRRRASSRRCSHNNMPKPHLAQVHAYMWQTGAAGSDRAGQSLQPAAARLHHCSLPVQPFWQVRLQVGQKKRLLVPVHHL